MSIKMEHVSYVYSTGTAFEIRALDDVTVEIPDGQFIAVIGHTGSGKSTLIQHLNGLLRPTSGTVEWDGKNICADNFDMKKLRQNVGLVFQYPENQLFETDVITDVQFGPKNQGLSPEDARKEAEWALQQVKLDSKYYDMSPFELSGGQKRRAAIAGILAMHPKVLVLDEPTAGLDPAGRDEILDMVSELHRNQHITVMLVSHSMEDVANYAQRIIVMNHGRIIFDDIPSQVFSHWKELEQIGLAAPQVTYMMHTLKEKGWDIDTSVTTIPQARDEILKSLGIGNSADSGTQK